MNGYPAAVLFSADEYESLLETLDVLSDSQLVADLLASRQAYAAGQTFSIDEALAERADRHRSA